MADKRFYIKISGAAWDITGPTAQDAINSIKAHAYAYCGFTALEIGVDCDENGYPLMKQELDGTLDANGFVVRVK